MQAPSTITVKGEVYQIGRLDPLSQFHISRRLAPVLASMGGAALKLAIEGKQLGVDDMVDFMGPVSEVVSKMSDEDVNYIIQACLHVVQREQQSGKWARVQVSGRMMFEDIDMLGMIRLTAEVVKENLGGFFVQLRDAVQPSPSSSESKAQASTT